MSTNTPPPQIAIDPALQQSASSSTTAPYYNQYASQYNFQASSSRGGGGGGGGGGGSGGDDLANMNDALGSAGIDLRAEEESLHRSSTPNAIYRSSSSSSTYPGSHHITADRTKSQASSVTISPYFLSTTMQAICSQHGIQKKVPDDTVSYLALATRMRLEEIIEKMIRAAKHRENARFDREPGFYTSEGGGDQDKTAMWSVKVRRDVRKQLDALEKAEREDESKARRERKERQDAANAALDSLNQAAGSSMDIDDEDGQPKKKRKKEGPGVQAKNLSEDVRKKLSDDTAMQAAGRKKYAWMSVGAGGAAATTGRGSPKPPAQASTSGAAAAASTTSPTPTTATGGGWARAYVPRPKKSQLGEQDKEKQKEVDTRMPITLRDAMFVVSSERGHGAGRGAAHGYV